jgi:hypothetical protein
MTIGLKLSVDISLRAISFRISGWHEATTADAGIEEHELALSSAFAFNEVQGRERRFKPRRMISSGSAGMVRT